MVQSKRGWLSRATNTHAYKSPKGWADWEERLNRHQNSASGRDKTGIIHHNMTDPSKFEKYRVIGVYAYNYPALDPLIAKILQHYSSGLSIKKSIIKVGIYTFANREVTVKALEVIIANFLKRNMPKMIEFFNILHNEDDDE